MPPKYAKADVQRGKAYAGDAAAICEAAEQEAVDQQGLSILHRARPQLIGQRPQLINAVRGHLSELGIVAAGLLGLAELAAIARDESDQRLPATYDF